MRIAHFIHRYPPALGGSESYFARLSEFLVAGGDDVTVFTSNALDLTAFWSPKGKCLPAGISVENGVEVRRYPLWRMRGRRWLLRPLSLIPERRWQGSLMPCNPISFSLWRDVRKQPFHFDVVHASAFPYAFPIVCAQHLARRLQVPFCLTPFLHTGDPRNPRDATRRAYTSPALVSLLRAADVVFVQTPGERQAILQCGVDSEKIILQGLGVDAAECTGGNRQRARQRWEIGDGAVIGHLANNSEEKGTVDLLRAAALLWQENLAFHIVLAGPEMPNFQRFWHTYPYKKNVLRLGQLSEEEKHDFFAAIDVFALPSRSDSFGLVLLEAWANGVPNIGYRAGGIADVIQHEQDGLLVPCGDVLALATAMRRLLTDSEMGRQLGRSGKERTLTDFAWEDKLQLVKSMYRRRSFHVHSA